MSITNDEIKTEWEPGDALVVTMDGGGDADGGADGGDSDGGADGGDGGADGAPAPGGDSDGADA